jgi:NAD(P)H-hydrate repair Nnr-like enzyme with NAD(P)H-hydrate dehydratase domain
MHHPGDFMDTRHSFVGSRVFAAIATFALTAGTVAFAQQTATPSDNTQSTQSSTATSKPSKAERKAARKERKEKMGKELGLTADQKKQMKALKQDQRKQMNAVKDDTSLSQEQKAAKFKEIHKAGMEKRDAILTPEQREKLQHLRSENEENEGGERHHRHHKSSAPATTPAPPSK